MTGQKNRKRVIWAVDAFQECSEIDQRCIEMIRALSAYVQLEAEPVYVIPPQQISSPFEVIYPPFRYYGEEAAESLKDRLKIITSPKLCSPKVLDKPVMTTVGAVKELSKYAAETQTDLIVVGTHCRKGISRFFLGSFAESLLLHSHTPLLVVGAHATQATKIESIFFPTDFGKTSEAVFPRVLELAKSLSAKIYLYHMIPKPIVLPTGIIPPAGLPALLEEDKKNAREKLEVLNKMADRIGVKSEIFFELSESSESDAILNAAKAKNSSLIAMAAQSGAVLSTIAGSTTRQVVRGSFCPVWVLHAHGLAQKTPFSVTEEEVMSDLTEHGWERKPA